MTKLPLCQVTYLGLNTLALPVFGSSYGDSLSEVALSDSYRLASTISSRPICLE